MVFGFPEFFVVRNAFDITGLKVTVGHQILSDRNQKLSDQIKNTPDILSDGKNSKQISMSDQIIFLSDHKLKMSDKSFNPF